MHRNPSDNSCPWLLSPSDVPTWLRMYRSGDLARWLADGTIEFLGRIDHQVKIRGHRIEPEEIANVLRERGGVSDAAVIVVPSAGGHPRLVAYVATRGGVVTADALRVTCAEWLPDYMVPSVVVVLDTLPLTPSGKLDRAAIVEVLKQASWGTTRDNLVLGSEGNGIDGAHILTPMPYLISAGRVTQNNVPVPMYILARRG